MKNRKSIIDLEQVDIFEAEMIHCEHFHETEKENPRAEGRTYLHQNCNHPKGPVLCCKAKCPNNINSKQSEA